MEERKMKQKMLNVKEYVIAHKKQILIGAAVVTVVVLGGKALSKKFKTVEISEDTFEELTGGVIEEIAIKEEN
jgi:DNA-binding protein YbaB